MNLLMISGDSSIAAGRQGPFVRMLERFARAWTRIDVITPRPAAVTTTALFDNVHVHASARPRALLWRHIVERGTALHRERPYALMISHDHGWHLNGLGAWRLHRRTGTPYVSEFHGFPGSPRSATLRAWAQGQASRLYVRLVRRQVAAFRVVNAGDLPAVLGRLGVPADKILVLHALYLDFETFAPRETPKRYDVMFCGRAERNKGGALMLEAFQSFVVRRPAATLLMVTAGPAARAWRRLADRLGVGAQVTWRPWVESAEGLADLYRASRVFACTSYSEGGPRVTAEAMACGVPVVSTPVGLMPELIDDGASGRLVDWRPDAVATAIADLVADPDAAAAMGEAGRRRVARFDKDAVIDACATAYRDLAARAAPPEARRA